MPTERLSMRRIRQILQLHFGAQASARAIARELGVARSTVQGYLAGASSAELGWPLPADVTDPILCLGALVSTGEPEAGRAALR
jgi:hypothetical protein